MVVKKYYIFGAHSRGQTLGVYIAGLYPYWELLGYLYNNDEDNPDKVGEVPVICLSKRSNLDLKAEVFIATRGIFHDDIENELRTIGFTNIKRVTPDFDNEIRNKFMPGYFSEKGREYRRLDSLLGEVGTLSDKSDISVNVYVVKSAFDSDLSSSFDLKLYEEYIQAGKALTDKKVVGCDVFDDTGDNISDMNRQMCDVLTGLDVHSCDTSNR